MDLTGIEQREAAHKRENQRAARKYGEVAIGSEDFSKRHQRAMWTLQDICKATTLTSGKGAQRFPTDPILLRKSEQGRTSATVFPCDSSGHDCPASSAVAFEIVVKTTGADGLRRQIAEEYFSQNSQRLPELEQTVEMLYTAVLDTELNSGFQPYVAELQQRVAQTHLLTALSA